MPAYIKIETQEYPLYEGDIKLRFPNVSFPNSFVPPEGYATVIESPRPAVDYTKNVAEASPEKTGAEEWTQAWLITDASAEEIAQRTGDKATEVRGERARRLKDCDWTQVADAPVDQAAWATYRQALRDIPAQAGFPLNFEWPVQP